VANKSRRIFELLGFLGWAIKADLLISRLITVRLGCNLAQCSRCPRRHTFFWRDIKGNPKLRSNIAELLIIIILLSSYNVMSPLQLSPLTPLIFKHFHSLTNYHSNYVNHVVNGCVCNNKVIIILCAKQICSAPDYNRTPSLTPTPVLSNWPWF
jgi:hypothetical protein